MAWPLRNARSLPHPIPRGIPRMRFTALMTLLSLSLAANAQDAGAPKVAMDAKAPAVAAAQDAGAVADLPAELARSHDTMKATQGQLEQAQAKFVADLRTWTERNLAMDAGAAAKSVKLKGSQEALIKKHQQILARHAAAV